MDTQFSKMHMNITQIKTISPINPPHEPRSPKEIQDSRKTLEEARANRLKSHDQIHYAIQEDYFGEDNDN
jgi:uncharacterized membrane protein